MAERYRIKTLSEEEQKKLSQWEQSSPGTIDYIEQNGKLPEKISNDLSNHITSNLNQLDDGTQFGRNLKEYIQKNNKIPDQSTFEMLKRGTSGSKNYLVNSIEDYAKLNNIVSKLPTNEQAYQKYISNVPTNVSDLTDEELQNYLGAYSGLGKSDETSKSIQSILNERSAYSQKEGDIEDYLTRLETEMPAETEALMAGETSRALTQFKDVETPYIQQQAASKGQLRSGAVDDLLTSSALDIQSNLENMRVSLESSDLQFIGNAAYREKVRQLLKTSSDLSTSLEQERATALTTKSQAFQSAQSDLDIAQQERLSEQRYNQQLKAQEAQYKRQQEESSRQEKNQWLQTGASVIGGIGGSYLGGKLAKAD